MATTTSTIASRDPAYQQALDMLGDDTVAAALARLQRGIEKEGLRCSNEGVISQKPHPKGLGSTLTHPSITTDYSEALLEFITPVYGSAHEAIASLDVAHRFAYSQMEAELIWPSSMPCVLNGEMSVPIADYGSSNIGRLKHVYRHGLWHRYGRIMQCIAGIHYNFSVPDSLWEALKQQDDVAGESMQDFVSRRYFGLIRNFRRYSWLLLYLFGASPAVCRTFLEGKQHNLETLHKHTLYAPYATSLRMSDLGYTNNAQAGLRVCYNSVDDYVRTLGAAMEIKEPRYQEMGVQNDAGDYMQLNTNLLQIENEFYSDIRPKRVAKHGEKPLQSLDRYGVEYIEVRCTDLNPYLPVGIDVPQAAFMDTFLMYCLLKDSAPIDDVEFNCLRQNLEKTVMRGREPGLMLSRCRECGGDDISLQDWGLELLDDMADLAQRMDQANHHSFHQDSLQQQRLKVIDANLTPSAMVLNTLKETGMEFAEFTLDQARQHRKAMSEPLTGATAQHWKDKAKRSLEEQAALEAGDDMPFDQFLHQYLNR